MPQDPFIREKFTRLRTAAGQLAAKYFERFPKDRYLTEVESWRHKTDSIPPLSMHTVADGGERRTGT